MRERFLLFAGRNIKRWSDLTGETNFFSSLIIDPKQLSYCKRKWHVGFDFNCGGAQREYLFALVRWMAFNVAERGRYFYDGEAVPVDPMEYDDWIPKDFGYPIFDWERNEVRIRAEIRRLTLAWASD